MTAHASMRAVGGSAEGATPRGRRGVDVNDLVRAMLDVAGTLMGYVDGEIESEDPLFDPATARATRDHGILAETIRAWPGALRSAHPDAAMSDTGGRAAWLVADHPFQYGYGEGSPLDTITLLHFSEHAARIPDKRVTRYRRRMAKGRVGAAGRAKSYAFDAADLHRFGVAWLEAKIR